MPRLQLRDLSFDEEQRVKTTCSVCGRRVNFNTNDPKDPQVSFECECGEAGTVYSNIDKHLWLLTHARKLAEVTVADHKAAGDVGRLRYLASDADELKDLSGELMDVDGII